MSYRCPSCGGKGCSICGGAGWIGSAEPVDSELEPGKLLAPGRIVHVPGEPNLCGDALLWLAASLAAWGCLTVGIVAAALGALELARTLALLGLVPAIYLGLQRS